MNIIEQGLALQAASIRRFPRPERLPVTLHLRGDTMIHGEASTTEYPNDYAKRVAAAIKAGKNPRHVEAVEVMYPAGNGAVSHVGIMIVIQQRYRREGI